MDPVSDADDWARVLASDGEAFGRIFDRHRARVFRHCRRLLAHGHDADDVLAIAFLETWRQRQSVRLVDGSILPWLLLTATNSARNFTRAARRYKAVLDRLPMPSDSLDPVSERFDDEALSAFRKLRPADRQIVSLCLIEQLTEKQVAEVLGIAPGTVKSRLSRAKTRLRAIYAGSIIVSKEGVVT